MHAGRYRYAMDWYDLSLCSHGTYFLYYVDVCVVGVVNAEALKELIWATDIA